MTANRITRISAALMTLFAATALLDVLLLGYMRPPQADEGAGAHIFQLAIAALLPTGLVFVGTADWQQPVRTMKRIAVPAAIVVLAFAALVYLEHSFYPAHYPMPHR